ncbi:Ada metal-binding domain-containing protein [Nonomuraea monospora]|uniref:Ada metal-binding domain-containing protein n=1 Tax=Nonomuraea monospora TaxID=568818 RepID=UPI003CD0B678
MSPARGATRVVVAFTLVGADGRTYASPVPGTLGGHRKARLYGRLDCPSALRAIARGGYVRERVFFADARTAVAAGYRPCAVCLPEEYRLWRDAGLANLPAASSGRRAGGRSSRSPRLTSSPAPCREPATPRCPAPV